MAPKESLLVLLACFLLAATGYASPPHIPVDPPIYHHPPVKPPTHPPVKPPVHPPTKSPAHPPIKPPVHPPVKPPAHPPVKPPTKPPVHPPVNPPAHPPVKPPVHPPVKPPAHPPVKPPTHPPVKPPVHPPVKPPAHPAHPPVKPLSPSPSPYGHVDECRKRCQPKEEHHSLRRCMRICGACFSKYKCVPYDENKGKYCQKWDKVIYHDKEEKCP